MKPTLLHGEYDVNIDDKNRMLVPAEVRRALDPERDGESFYITVGENRRPWLYPERRYEALVSTLESSLAPDESKVEFDHIMFSLSSRVEWDKQGRILIVEKYRTRTKLNREVTLIGARDHLELWNRDEWAAHYEDLETRRPEIMARQRAQAAAQRGTPTLVPATVMVSATV